MTVHLPILFSAHECCRLCVSVLLFVLKMSTIEISKSLYVVFMQISQIRRNLNKRHLNTVTLNTVGIQIPNTGNISILGVLVFVRNKYRTVVCFKPFWLFSKHSKTGPVGKNKMAAIMSSTVDI